MRENWFGRGSFGLHIAVGLLLATAFQAFSAPRSPLPPLPEPNPLAQLTLWFAAYAFGGTNYSTTPIGAVSHTDEPGRDMNAPADYFGFWASGENFGICAWNSRTVQYFQAVGDPLVKK